MKMTPFMRRVSLSAHISVSVGWIGAILGFFVLSLAALGSADPGVVRSCYIAMDLVGRYALVPMSLAALATGIIAAVGSDWGLLRHYWILAKLFLTVFATSGLLLHQFSAVSEAARLASGTINGTFPAAGQLGRQLAANAGLGLVVLLVICVISVFKPWGPVPGQRVLFAQRSAAGALDAPPFLVLIRQLPLGLKVGLALAAITLVAFVLLHLAGGGFGGHGRH